MFLSDNGAEGAAYEGLPVMGPDLMKVLHRYYDNSLDNIGNHDSFVWYGPHWAQAATAPSRLFKNYSTQGGIRVPLILRLPPRYQKQNTTGKLVKAFSSIMDITPTCLELASVQHPVAMTDHKAEGSLPATAMFHGHAVYGLRGKSWKSYLSDGNGSLDDMQGIWSNFDSVGWELFGRGALRRGPWKLVHMPNWSFGTGDWELYNIAVDPGEENDLAADPAHREILKTMVQAWNQYVSETGTVWGKELKQTAGWTKAAFAEDQAGGDSLMETQAWMDVNDGWIPANEPLHT